jgi:predicted transcriptional regulator
MQPCESAVKYKVPAIKAELARKLKKECKSQKEIAKLLGVTEAAVSQYLSGKRANKKETKTKEINSIPDVCKLCGMCNFK